jgi:hypothetical protein
VDKFSHGRFEPSGMTRNAEIRFAKSIVDYIFRWLASKFLSNDAQYNAGVNGRELEGHGNGHSLTPTAAVPPPAMAAPTLVNPHTTIQNQEDAPPCSTCGSIMIAAARAGRNCGTRPAARSDSTRWRAEVLQVRFRVALFVSATRFIRQRRAVVDSSAHRLRGPRGSGSPLGGLAGMKRTSRTALWGQPEPDGTAVRRVGRLAGFRKTADASAPYLRPEASSVAGARVGVRGFCRFIISGARIIFTWTGSAAKRCPPSTAPR